MGVGRFDLARAGVNSDAKQQNCADPTCRDNGYEHERHGQDHSKVFSTWSYESDEPLALEALREKLRKLPGTIYRAKGVVYTTDIPQRRAVLQVVGRRVDISYQEEWGQRVRRTQIVAIGAPGGIDAGMLENTFASCISAAAARA